MKRVTRFKFYRDMPKTNSENIWKFIKIPKDPDGCWEWTGGTNSRGYGSVCFMNKQYLAHRFVYEYLIGEIPKEKEMDHKCRIKNCVNPTHLQPVIHKINCSRGDVNQNKNKTHCIYNHEFTKENTYYNRKSKKRSCRMCRLLRYIPKIKRREVMILNV